MPVLVCEHDTDRGRAEFVGELGEQPVLTVVVDDEIAERAVERNELLQFFVGRAGLTTSWEIVGPFGYPANTCPSSGT